MAPGALLGTGHQPLVTTLGPLDVFGAIEGGRDYPSLLPEAVTVQVEGQPVRVVRLEALAELKRGATSAKDRLVLALLEDTIRQRGGGSPAAVLVPAELGRQAAADLEHAMVLTGRW